MRPEPSFSARSHRDWDDGVVTVDALPPGRIRLPRSVFIGVFVLALCTLPLVALAPWWSLLLLLPAVAGLYAWRTGVDFTAVGVTVQATFRATDVAWADVAGVETRGRDELWLVRRDGRLLRLPTLRARDLTRVHELSGGRLGLPPTPGQTSLPRA